jgi:2-oxoisovalerate dehydrogenase E2 component (dihydrolipoyl transacylase)
MATQVLAPLLGEGVNELTIVRWLKQEGDPIKELESLLEVETDKVITEVPSPASGTLLKQLASENGVVNVGTVIAWIGEPGEKIPTQVGSGSAVVVPEKVLETHMEKSLSMSPVSEGGRAGNNRGFISPVVAKIAREKNIDLKQVNGSGLGGRITKKDLLEYLEAGKKDFVTSTLTGNIPGDRLVPLNVVRKAIAKRMIVSKQTSAHVLTAMEADMSRVIAHLAANKEAFARDGLNLTYTAYFISAIVTGLKAFPVVNSSWSEQGLILHSVCNIGMATSLGEEGLIVPVVKNADRLSLAGITRTVNDLAGRARTKKLQPEDVKDGTFTLTNHGVSGSLFAMPIINQPQCGILGTGAIKKRPIVVTDAAGNEAIAIRPMIYLSFVFDHRILDGAMADWFLAKVVESLENWQ